MPNLDIILAKSSNGKEITAQECLNYIQQKSKKQLSDFIYDRLYGRYLKPFEFNSTEFNLMYKSGFLIMTSCCLLIETYVSFIKKEYRNTKNNSRECFAYFFTTESFFSELAVGGIKADGSFAKSKEGGLSNDFYDNVRCGILHNGETRNGWTITRNRNKPYFDPATKVINATKFADRLKRVIRQYKISLKNSDFDNDIIWENFINRLNDLISKS